MPSRITVIGSGYVGLTTGACFSHLGHHVTCTDIDPERVAMLNRGEVPILEAGLDNFIREGLTGGQLNFVVGSSEAAAASEFVYLCVPTPQGTDGSADLTHIEAAAAEIGPVLPSEAIVVNKSTVPVGSTRVVERALGRSDVFVVSNPEFLREGSAVHDFLNPDRIVIGADDQSAAMRVASLYLGIPAPLIVTDPPSAELIKYASNAFLAAKVSFVNAVAAVCEAVGADMNDVVLGMGSDKRIGHEFLRPGPGWGGSCFVGEETALVRREGRIRLLAFDRLFSEVERVGASGWEILTWAEGSSSPEFERIERFTARPYEGDVITVKTKMGRRITVTADHPLVVGDGMSGRSDDKLAADLAVTDWLPIAQGFPLVVDDPGFGRLLEGAGPAGIGPEQVIARVDPLQRELLEQRSAALGSSRRRDVLRASTARVAELQSMSIPTLRGRFGTTTNGTYVPDVIPFDEDFWRVIGLYLAEGHMSTDVARTRIAWSFGPIGEEDLVEAVAAYWRSLGVRVAVRTLATTRQVSISSRLLASWFEHVLALGRGAYDHRIPDQIWSAPESQKRALLRGLWDGDGSWSLVQGGPSVVLEYGTVSRALADGIVRLLGDLGIVARVKVGRTPKSTVDTYWLIVSGADQVEAALWLLPEDEQATVLAAITRQTKRTLPTGYRRLDDKAVAWVRVTSLERRPFAGMVYSVEVPITNTIVTSFGLVAHNCFPKDSRALIRIAEDAGYSFDLLEGVVEVNDEQFDRVAGKAIELVGGSVEGVQVAVWGLTFKARTDDLRESPSLSIVERLRDKGAKIRAFDPSISPPVEPHKAARLEGIEIASDPYSACEGAEVLVLLTEWDEFKWLDFDKVAESLASLRIVDGRNLLDREALRRRGFVYQGIGRV
ncbi:MAG TPA: nucleotide sugar dehydrogenase [Acidimicrobiales bacterium]|nr:nucleotide sugar dehydrogenase [Acidimicrobiales bacterium]